MNIGIPGLKIICYYSGYNSKPYLVNEKDKLYKIGYGTTLYLDGSKVEKDDLPISRERAMILLKNELTNIQENEIKKLIKQDLNQNQFDALVSLFYSSEKENLLKSELFNMINVNPNDSEIKKEFLIYVGEDQKLLDRRNEEIDLYFTSFNEKN